MSSTKPISLVRIEYAEAAEAYLRSLPPEHFMEATPQARQRKITLCSFDVIHESRPDIQLFNELLVQYRHGRKQLLGQVVPDNMAVVCGEEIKAENSYDIALQPERPYWMFEYVSKYSQRKDYEDSFRKYERELKVPYYLLFYPDQQELTLFRHNGKKYVSVKPNEAGRLTVTELETEVALVDGWVRFWFRGQLVPLTAELLRDLEETRRRAEREKRRADRLEQGLVDQKGRTEEEKRRADEEKRRADEEKRRADLAEQELQRLRAQLRGR